MTWKTLNFVYNLRIGFYIALFASLIIKVIILLPPIHAEEDDVPPAYDLFWPPDMVPHPMPPTQEEEKNRIS